MATQTSLRAAATRTPWTHRIFVANLVFEILIVLTGGIVRLTESGLGCTTAPECVPGSIVPLAQQNEGMHTAIEFGNRMLSVIVGLVAIAALVAAIRSGRRALIGWAVLAGLGVPAQAVIGAITVRVGLHPASVTAHFLVSMVLVWAATVLLVRSQESDAAPHLAVPTAARRVAIALSGDLVLLLIAGTVTTGTGPHSGDSDTLTRYQLPLAAVTGVHALVGMAFAVLAVWLYILLRTAQPAAPQRAVTAAQWLLAATVIQIGLGWGQYLTGLPIVPVALHMLGAALLTAATTWVTLSLRVRD